MGKEKVAVIGLGYVGLPLACLCAGKGFSVTGLDVDAGKVELINSGESPLKDTYLDKAIPALAGKIRATTDAAEALTGAGIAIVCVPTPAVGDKPDLSCVKSACNELSKHLSKGMLVIVESTVYPGTVAEIVKPILEKGSGLKAGEGFFLGHCPERIDPGNERFTVGTIPRVMACLSKEGTTKARRFYSSILDAEITVLSSVKAAEAVKVVENTFRDINIAFVNELAKSFDKMGIDLSEVIKGASTKPFGYMPFYPGPGVGGHCIAQDPYYLIQRAREAGFEHQFLKLARRINNSMPEYVVSLLLAGLKEKGIQEKGAKVCVLGLSYKPGVADLRESPGMKVADLLKKQGLAVGTFDPFVGAESTASSLEDALKGTDAVVLATHHKQIVDSLSAAFLKKHGVKVVIDARNALDKESILAAGIYYKGVGR